MFRSFTDCWPGTSCSLEVVAPIELDQARARKFWPAAMVLQATAGIRAAGRQAPGFLEALSPACPLPPAWGKQRLPAEGTSLGQGMAGLGFVWPWTRRRTAQNSRPKHGNIGGLAHDNCPIDPRDVDSFPRNPLALLSLTQCSCDALLARCGFSGSWPNV